MNAKEFLIELLKFKFITPNDDGALNLTAMELSGFGAFFIEKGGIKDLLLTKRFKDEGEHLALGGHVDMVLAGEGWSNNVFAPVEKEGFIYAKDAQDVKSGVAALVDAVKNADSKGVRLSLISTNDKESEAIYRTKAVLEWMQERDMLSDYAVVAEPICVKKVGDSVKIGRRGSINGKLLICGKREHTAYPEKCINPVHDFASVLKLLAGFDLDPGSTEFSPSKIVITDIRGGMGVCNVTPNDLRLMFNVRNSPDTNLEDVKSYVEKICHGLNYELELKQSSEAFLTNIDNKTVQKMNESVQEITHEVPEFDTKGGTSDARYFTKYSVRVVEFGVCNDKIHAIDERVSIKKFEKSCLVFKDLIESF